MMVAVLLGALSLGACVDDNESASVTAVRTAKAKQLEAVAALNNAQAEAELIKANAEKALKEAKAAYEKAQADATAATTEYNKQKYALELEKIKAEYEKLIAQYKANTAEYDKELWDNADAFVKDVYGKYIAGLGKVNTINKALIDQNLKLAQIDIDEIQAKAALESFLYEKNQTIVQNTLEISRLEALKTADKAAIEKQMSEIAANAYNLNMSDLSAVKKAESAAKDAYKKAFNPIDYNYGQNLIGHDQISWEAGLLPYIQSWIRLAEISNGSVGGVTYYFTSAKTVKIEVEECYSTEIMYMMTLSTKGDFLLAEDFKTRQYKSLLDHEKDALGKPSVSNVSAATGLYIELEAAQAEVAQAKKDLAAELAKPAADQDKTKIAALNRVIDATGPQRIAYAETAIADQQEIVNKYQESLDRLLSDIATVQDAAAVAEYEKAFAAAKEAAEKYVAAKHEVHKVEEAITLIGINTFDSNGAPISPASESEYAKLKTLLDGTVNVDELILACKENIAEAEAAIKSGGAQDFVTITNGSVEVYDPIAGYLMYSGNGDIKIYKYAAEMTVEQKKAIIQAEIDKLNEKLKTQQALVKQYKAKLDTLLAAE